MGSKRAKLFKGLGDFVPVSMNFSDLKREHDGEREGLHFEPTDDGLERKRLENSMEYEEMVVQILYSLEGREKLIFAFQLLREAGYQIDHGSFAKSVKLSRRQYMRVLDDVRMKSGLFVMGYNNRVRSHKDKQ